MITDERITALRSLLDASTRGEWEAILDGDPREQPQLMYRGLVAWLQCSPDRHLSIVAKGGYVDPSQWPANARLIAAAVSALPQLLDEIERLRRDRP